MMAGALGRGFSDDQASSARAKARAERESKARSPAKSRSKPEANLNHPREKKKVLPSSSSSSSSSRHDRVKEEEEQTGSGSGSGSSSNSGSEDDDSDWESRDRSGSGSGSFQESSGSGSGSGSQSSGSGLGSEEIEISDSNERRSGKRSSKRGRKETNGSTVLNSSVGLPMKRLSENDGGENPKKSKSGKEEVVVVEKTENGASLSAAKVDSQNVEENVTANAGSQQAQNGSPVSGTQPQLHHQLHHVHIQGQSQAHQPHAYVQMLHPHQSFMIHQSLQQQQQLREYLNSLHPDVAREVQYRILQAEVQAQARKEAQERANRFLQMHLNKKTPEVVDLVGDTDEEEEHRQVQLQQQQQQMLMGYTQFQDQYEPRFQQPTSSGADAGSHPYQFVAPQAMHVYHPTGTSSSSSPAHHFHHEPLQLRHRPHLSHLNAVEVLYNPVGTNMSASIPSSSSSVARKSHVRMSSSSSTRRSSSMPKPVPWPPESASSKERIILIL